MKPANELKSFHYVQMHAECFYCTKTCFILKEYVLLCF